MSQTRSLPRLLYQKPLEDPGHSLELRYGSTRLEIKRRTKPQPPRGPRGLCYRLYFRRVLDLLSRWDGDGKPTLKDILEYTSGRLEEDPLHLLLPQVVRQP